MHRVVNALRLGLSMHLPPLLEEVLPRVPHVLEETVAFLNVALRLGSVRKRLLQVLLSDRRLFSQIGIVIVLRQERDAN